MNRAEYALWLGWQAALALVQFWGVTFILALLAGGAMLNDYWGARLKLDRRLAYLFLPWVGCVVTLLIGSVFHNVRGVPFYLPIIGIGISISLAIASGVLAKRAWMSSVSISLCCLWYSLWSGYAAFMSISGI